MDRYETSTFIFGAGLSMLMLFLDVILRIIALYLSVLAIKSLKKYLRDRS